jgi:hypothetical protein
MLRRESFPPNEHVQYFELPPAWQAHQPITEQAVERAHFPQSVGKAPCPDKLSFRAVRVLWCWEKERIVEQARAVIRRGRHPAVWKRVSGVVMRKPGNDKYPKLKADRSSLLLSYMGKVVEKVGAELLAEKAERRGLLSDGQYGSRKRRSAINAAAIMVDRAYTAWRGGHIAGVLLMDIKAAFPSVGRGRLFHTMRGKGMDRDLIRWTACVLTDRTVGMVIDGNVMKRHPVEGGIPQGSLVSPILFAFYTSVLIKWVKEKVSGEEGMSFVTTLDGWRRGTTLTRTSGHLNPAPE